MDTEVEKIKTEQTQDKLTQAIGEFGRWQIVLLIVFTAPIRMSNAWNHLGIVFLAPRTTFWCVDGRNLTQYIKNLTCYTDCTKYEYYTDFENSIISEWDLVCDRAWLANFTQTACMFGVLLGSIFFGFIADRFGRRPTLLIACTLQLITCLTAPFCTDYWTFTVVRFAIGAATAGTMLTSFIFIMETTGIRKRELINCLCAIPLPLGEMIMPIFAYYLKTWDRYSLGIAIPNLIFLTFFFLIPESPKWLISVGRLEEASAVMAKVAKWNKLPSDNMLEIAKKIANETTTNNNGARGKATYLDLVRTPSLRVKNLYSCFTWFILGLSFYGSNQYIGQTSSNVFITMAMAGVLQIPGIVLSGFLCRRLGRRITLIYLFIICAISNSLLSVPDTWFYVKLVVGSIGVSCASGAFAAMYMYTTELFPTVARNMAMGASSTVSRVGSMLAPFVAGLGFTGKWIPPAIFGAVPLTAAVACYCLPETRGKKLTDQIVEP